MEEQERTRMHLQAEIEKELHGEEMQQEMDMQRMLCSALFNKWHHLM